MGANRYAVDFTDPFDSDFSIYQFSITGVEDLNGNTVNAPTNLGFRCGDDETAPSLIRANVTSANAEFTSVMLTFSESVDEVTANQTANYKYGANAYGFNVYTATRQSNPAQVLVTFIPGISPGGYQIRVGNVKDLVDNVILDNGTNNTQPIIVNAPVSFGGGAVFRRPLRRRDKGGDDVVIYNGKLYVGRGRATQRRLFETDYGSYTRARRLCSTRTGFSRSTDLRASTVYDYIQRQRNTKPGTITKGVDTLYAACIGGPLLPT